MFRIISFLIFSSMVWASQDSWLDKAIDGRLSYCGVSPIFHPGTNNTYNQLVIDGNFKGNYLVGKEDSKLNEAIAKLIENGTCYEAQDLTLHKAATNQLGKCWVHLNYHVFLGSYKHIYYIDREYQESVYADSKYGGEEYLSQKIHDDVQNGKCL